VQYISTAVCGASVAKIVIGLSARSIVTWASLDVIKEMKSGEVERCDVEVKAK
jgi:hypothetical protein